METVFEASTGVEAHMILHLLEQGGIEGRVDGEYLQGGVGELPAAGNIRVVVESQHATTARRIIAEWESNQPTELPVEGPKQPKPSYAGTIGFLIGASLSSAVLLWAYNVPFTDEGVDYDGDGLLDETYQWRGDFISQIDGDRNGDGEIDVRYLYSHRLGIDGAESDDDFDGVFEHFTRYKAAKAVSDEIDSNGDGLVDYRSRFRHGVIIGRDLIDPVDRIIRKRERYEDGRLVEADWDSDGDGKFDSLIKYDAFEEELSRSTIQTVGR